MYSFHTDWLFKELPVLIEKGILTEEAAEKLPSLLNETGITEDFFLGSLSKSLITTTPPANW